MLPMRLIVREERMRKAFIILTGIIFTLLFSACKQFTADIDDYLGYWSSEAFILSSAIDKETHNDRSGMTSVASADDVTVTLKVRNPRSFRFVMPSPSETRNIVEFAHFSGTKPIANNQYEMKQLSADTLQLVYKDSFLKNSEWGEKDISSTITLYADDGRVFKQTFTVPLKANTRPPKPRYVVAKTKGSSAYYVLCITVPDMDKKLQGEQRLHKDIKGISINEAVYTFSVDNTAHPPAFTKPDNEFFIMRSNVDKLGGSDADEVPTDSGWVLYYQTDVKVEPGAAKKDYTIRLVDEKGLFSEKLDASTNPNKPKIEGPNIVKGRKLSGSGSEADPVRIGTDSSGAELSLSSVPTNTKVHCTLTEIGSTASPKSYEGNPVTVPLPLNGAGEKNYKLEYYAGGTGFEATAKKTVYYKILQEYGVTFSVVDGQGKLQGAYGSQNLTAQNSGGTKTLTNVPHGTSVTFTATADNGYEVDSWTGVTPTPSNSTTATLSNIDGDKNVTVKFKNKSCTVTFKPNGGKLDGNTGDVRRTGNYGDSLTAPTAKRTGYTLSGWSPTLPSTFPAEDTTYTAQWKANTYRVRFNKNGPASDSMDDQIFTYDQSQELTKNRFKRTGYTFKGWTRNPSDSSVYYIDGAQVSNLTYIQNDVVNLYAVWEEITYTVTFSVAGGEGGTLKGKYSGNEITASGSEQKAFTVSQGSTVEFTATPDKGWDFDHWSGVSSTSLTATLSNITGDKTVTVKFKPGNLDFPGSESGSNLWEELKKEAAKTTGAHTIVIDREIKADLEPNNGEITLGRNLTIKGKNASAVLNADQRSRIFHVENGKTLTLENIKLEKGYDTRGDGGGVLVESGATLIMNNSSITGCTAKHGGGVYVAGTFTMEGSSSIIKCEATQRASGVYVSGTFTMQDSSFIQECGEGVNVSGTFNMQDSSSIQNCDNGVYVVSGTFNMKDGAEVVTNDEKNDVYLASGRSITVTGTLTKKPAARITPDSYTDGRVLATGAAEKANFKVTPKNGSEYWRYNKKDDVIKFVPATLTVTFVELKCVRVDDKDSDSEYFWTMNVDGKNPPISELTKDNLWVAQAGWSKNINESFTESFSFFPKEKKIPVDIEIWEYDKSSPNDHIGTTKAQLTYHYDHDAWQWGYVASGHENGNQGLNNYKLITEGEGPANEVEFTEQYRTGDGDTDVTIKISWKE